MQTRTDRLEQQPNQPIERCENGTYPVPRMRCGIVPYFVNKDNNIIWGCVASNRVGPVTFGIAAGIQDIVAIKDTHSVCLEVGKPFPDLGHDFLSAYVGALFRDPLYQEIIDCLIDNGFNLFIENPLKTAMHETKEEHGLDLDMEQGRDTDLLMALVPLPIEKLSGKLGANEQNFLLAQLKSIDTVKLSEVQKTDQKIKRNLGRQFYEKGCWKTLAEMRYAFDEETRKCPACPDVTSDQAALIKGVMQTYQETISFLERLELLIRSDLKPLASKAYDAEGKSSTASIFRETLFHKPQDSGVHHSNSFFTP
jgi:hypothetical protein